METTDTSEKGLESIIVASLVDGSGYVQGDPQDYDREYAVDWPKLLQFLSATQPETWELLDIGGEGPGRTQFLYRLQGEIAKRGVVDVLRSGIKHGTAHVSLFYDTGQCEGCGTLRGQHLQRHPSAPLQPHGNGPCP
jgi:type I restriction enzyme R subunit